MAMATGCGSAVTTYQDITGRYGRSPEEIGGGYRVMQLRGTRSKRRGVLGDDAGCCG